MHDERSRAPAVLALELEALVALHDGDPETAVDRLRAASAIEDAIPVEFGPPDIVKPSHELLGEVLLDLDRPAEAQIAFERALALAPGRVLALRGLGRSALAAGDAPAAQRAWTTVLRILQHADPDLPLLAEARAHVAAETE